VTARDLGRLAILGLGGMAVSNYTYYLAVARIPVATASLLIYTAPLLVLAASVLVLGEPFRRRDLGAAALTLAGAALVARAYEPAALSGSLAGVLLASMTAVGFAFYNLWGRRVAQALSPWTILTYSLAAAAALWLFLTPPWTLLFLPMSPARWAGFASIVLFGTLIPFSLFLAGLSRISAAHASVTSTIEPVVAATVAFLVLGETLAWPQLVGGGLVLGGVALLHLR
jgi:drug/metabolite transporter (DMT)-like permease